MMQGLNPVGDKFHLMRYDTSRTFLFRFTYPPCDFRSLHVVQDSY